MTLPRNSDDAELRRLLDSIGLSETDASRGAGEAEASVRAEAMLTRILEQPREVRARRSAPQVARRSARRWTTLSVATALATCVVVAIAILVMVPGPGPQPAAAQTPPMLTFSLVDAPDLQSGGEPARDALLALAERANQQPAPERLPVQRITAEAWWTSTDPADASSGPRTVLVPRHLEVYQFADGSRRSIERRGAAIDAQGRVTDEPGSWNNVSPTTDETFTNDLGTDYPATLADTVAGLRRQLAPKNACGESAGGCLLSAVSDLYAGYVADPAITSRLWRLLAAEPTIQTLGRTTDRLGRQAEVFIADALDPSQRILILVDPATGRYLGSETILVRPSPDLGFDPPAVTQFTAIVDARRVATSEVPDDSTTIRY